MRIHARAALLLAVPILLVATSGVASANHVRPKAATPKHDPLVPAYDPCVTPNTTGHIGQLVFGACVPVSGATANVALGTPPANLAVANGVGSQTLTVVLSPNNVNVVFKDSDIRCNSLAVNTGHCGAANNHLGNQTPSDYIGELQPRFDVIHTGHICQGSPTTCTAQTLPLSYTVPCTPTPSDLSRGSNCDITATMDALFGAGFATAFFTRNTSWQVNNVRVFDGGPDGVVGTSTGNTLFQVSGIFTP
jgi:hypothetical protein